MTVTVESPKLRRTPKRIVEISDKLRKDAEIAFRQATKSADLETSLKNIGERLGIEDREELRRFFLDANIDFDTPNYKLNMDEARVHVEKGNWYAALQTLLRIDNQPEVSLAVILDDMGMKKSEKDATLQEFRLA